VIWPKKWKKIYKHVEWMLPRVLPIEDNNTEQSTGARGTDLPTPLF
jgi:hypothetical protein